MDLMRIEENVEEVMQQKTGELTLMNVPSQIRDQVFEIVQRPGFRPSCWKQMVMNKESNRRDGYKEAEITGGIK